MKNILLITCGLFLITQATAQQTESSFASFKSASNSTVIDTVPNAGVKSQILRVPGYHDILTIVTTVTEISGATAGNVKLFGSLDNIAYAQIDTGVFNPSDQAAAQSYKWALKKSRYTWYKVTYTGAGTMSAKISTNALTRNPKVSSPGLLSQLKSASNNTVLDTITGTASKSQVLKLPGFQDMITIMATVTEISGTTGGAVRLYGSLDGVNYAIAKPEAFNPADVATAQSYRWEFDESPYTYWKLVYTGGSGNSAKFSSSMLSRKK